MREIKLETTIRVKEISELDEQESQLMQAAIEVARHAYARYSHFHVGAAALLSNGKIITGSNQENAAYPSGICAERVTLFYAGSQYPEATVDTLAIVSMINGQVNPDITPCGACRQVLLETEQRGNKPMRILLCGKEEVRIISSAKELLPLCFTSDTLPDNP